MATTGNYNKWLHNKLKNHGEAIGFLDAALKDYYKQKEKNEEDVDELLFAIEAVLKAQFTKSKNQEETREALRHTLKHLNISKVAEGAGIKKDALRHFKSGKIKKMGTYREDALTSFLRELFADIA